MPDPELLTVDEVASLLRLTPERVRDRVKRGSIPAECVVDAVKPMLFRARELRAWLGLAGSEASASATGGECA